MLKPISSKSRQTVAGETSCPVAFNFAASVEVFLLVHRRGDIGSPRGAGSNSRSKSCHKVWSLLVLDFTPAARFAHRSLNGWSARFQYGASAVKGGSRQSCRRSDKTHPTISEHLSAQRGIVGELPSPARVDSLPSQELRQPRLVGSSVQENPHGH